MNHTWRVLLGLLLTISPTLIVGQGYACGLSRDPEYCGNSRTVNQELECLAASNTFGQIMDCVKRNNVATGSGRDDSKLCIKVADPKYDLNPHDGRNSEYCIYTRDILLHQVDPGMDCRTCGLAGALQLCPKTDANFASCMCTFNNPISANQERLNCMNKCFGSAGPVVDCRKIRTSFTRYSKAVTSRANPQNSASGSAKSVISAQVPDIDVSRATPTSYAEDPDERYYEDNFVNFFSRSVWYDNQYANATGFFKRCVVDPYQPKVRCYLLKRRTVQSYDDLDPSDWYEPPVGADITAKNIEEVKVLPPANATMPVTPDPSNTVAGGKPEDGSKVSSGSRMSVSISFWSSFVVLFAGSII